ncbi:hydantoinase/oxoprolinase family protein [Methylobacterium indicum]|uniref:Methylhydantoinase n=1 Tax=Methylobacterium indicum TaxID=1775910 RepID=A0A8H9C980_9HYPH|nr:hydantoinase/oxoprolinase family protein [Methylobacterium indicum]BCM86751.1 methylhydantoinase [Methylobacterium indicum]
MTGLTSGIDRGGVRVAADIGGTFTDVALIHPDGRIATRKVPSTPADYAGGVVEGIRQILAAEGVPVGAVSEVLHACTVATNAILEGKGAKTGLITTAGFRDVLELRRIRVPRLYDPLYRKPPVLVPRDLRLEVDERLDFAGRVLTPLDDASVIRAIDRLAAEGVQAVAVCLLHSYANPAHERRIGALLHERLPDAFVSLSVDVLPEMREYERTSTTVINAYVGPAVRAYLESLVARLAAEGLPERLFMMHSAGGIVDARTVMRRPAQIVECGPAAGVLGARHRGAAAGLLDVISFDMGGTTAKASLIENGALSRTDEYEVGGGISLSSKLSKGGGYALKLPVIDISEVGAGGGSIVWIDKAGALKVGPHSAGAVPGPACYEAGGTAPTVTDANVVLGYLNPRALAGGSVPISAEASRRALRESVAEPLGLSLDEAAHGVHELVTTVMTRAVKSVSTYRGRDPRDFALLAFGGNGGIHAASLARALGITRIVVPPGAGVFSALGLLYAEVETGASVAHPRRLDAADPASLEAAYGVLEEQVLAELGETRQRLVLTRAADLRYAGQAFELTLDLDAGRDLGQAPFLFSEAHRRSYGYDLPGNPIEIVTLRVNGRLPRDASAPGRGRAAETPRETRRVYFGRGLGAHDTPVIGRADLAAGSRPGPLVIEEYEGTTLVPPDAAARLDPDGNILIALGIGTSNPRASDAIIGQSLAPWSPTHA